MEVTMTMNLSINDYSLIQKIELALVNFISTVNMRMLFVSDEDGKNDHYGEDNDDDDVDEDDVDQSVSAVDCTCEALCSLSRHNVHKLS